tara:strand:- start:247 stop:366 length:120 start_codon:yes stop_codon:yes gene_type:complete
MQSYDIPRECSGKDAVKELVRNLTRDLIAQYRDFDYHDR